MAFCGTRDGKMPKVILYYRAVIHTLIIPGTIRYTVDL